MISLQSVKVPTHHIRTNSTEPESLKSESIPNFEDDAAGKSWERNIEFEAEADQVLVNTPVKYATSCNGDLLVASLHSTISIFCLDGKYKLVRKVTVVERITCIQCCCLSSSRGFESFVIVGTDTGLVRIFDSLGNPVLCQELHCGCVSSINIHARGANCLEEVLVLYEDGVIVNIDGKSLHVAIKTLNANQLLSTEYGLRQAAKVADVISIGPVNTCEIEPLKFDTMTSTIPTETFTVCYIVAGDPFLAVHAITGASYAVSKVTKHISTSVKSVYTTIAKSFWTPQAVPPPELRIWKLPVIRSISDNDRRHGVSIRLAPACPISGDSRYAVVCDSLGRVTLLDTRQFLLTSMWKGMRDAQTGWIQIQDPDSPPSFQVESGFFCSSTPPRTLLVLVLLNPRGVVQLYLIPSGKSVGTFQTLPLSRLVQTTPVMGWHDSHTDGTINSFLSKCFLVAGDDLSEIVLDYQLIQELDTANDTAKA